jgi:WD40 domain-containing protein
VDVATGAVTTAAAPPPTELAAWVKQTGLTAPATLGLRAIDEASDGALIVGAASDAAFDRRGPMPPTPGVDRDWLIALDGSWQPRVVMWHGRGAITQIAIGERFVAAGGSGPVRIFARDAPGKELGASSFTGTIGVAWAPGDAVLAAIGDGKRVAVWRAGAWASPAATWEVGADYQAALAFDPARPVLAAASHDGHVRLYGVADGQVAAPPLVLDHDAGGDIRGLAFAPDSATLWVAVGPPVGKVIRFAVTASP